MAISNEAKLIAKALYNKSKRTFKYHKNDIIEQAKYFDPAYGAFIHKVISNNSLKISHASKKGSFEPIEANNADKKMSKRNLNKVVIDIRDIDVLPHEME